MEAYLSEKWALVGGASQGIGAAIATRFAEAGARVILMSRGVEKLEQVEKTLKEPGLAPCFSCGFGKLRKAFRSLDHDFYETTGPIEIVINNSGGPASGPLTVASAKEFEKGFRAHILASQTILQAVLPGMKEKTYGRIINILSTSVKIPIPNLGVSNTIRAAMANWSKTLAGEVGPWGITVNNILPGYTKTPRLTALSQAAAKRENKSQEEVERAWIDTIPARRFAEPSDIAEAALFLASPKASYINGTQLVVDGGRTGSL